MPSEDSAKSSTSDRQSKLDRLALRSLQILDEILIQRGTLQVFMKDGFISMAKARYSMGNNSVSSLQFPTQENQISAQHLVSSELSSTTDEVNFRTFTVRSWADDERQTADNEEQPRENTVRQRIQEMKKEDCDTDGNSKTKENDGKPKNGKKPVGAKDPLRWFGILVPHQLRDCQDGFKKSLHTVCCIATLQSELHAICKMYKELRAE